MKDWKIYATLTPRWAPFRLLSEEDRSTLITLVQSMIAEAKRESENVPGDHATEAQA